ncbi:hypothetical protein Tco_0467688 [Tanacetum coccineum]
MFEFLENRCIHEGQVIYPDFDDLVYVRSMFRHIGFDCLLDTNEEIVPHFILEFYGQYRVNYTIEGQISSLSSKINSFLTLSKNLVKFLSPELSNDRYVLYDRAMYPLTAQQERKTQKDYVTRRCRSSTSSSSTFDQPSYSHPNDDDDDDGNDEGTSHVSTPSPNHFFLNPPNVEADMEAFYTCQTEILNHQVQLRDEQHGRIRSIGKGITNLWRKKKK